MPIHVGLDVIGLHYVRQLYNRNASTQNDFSYIVYNLLD